MYMANKNNLFIVTGLYYLTFCMQTSHELKLIIGSLLGLFTFVLIRPFGTSINKYMYFYKKIANIYIVV